MKKRNIAATVSDPTMPKTPIEIGGKHFDLCLDFGALAEAETKINTELMRQGRLDRVNLLAVMCEMNLANTRILFAAALRTFHPAVGFDEAISMVRPENLVTVAMSLRGAWVEAMPESDPNQNPPTA